MPTVLRVGPYRFFFYASDETEPEHIHVESGDNAAKFWLTPVRLAGSGGFSGRAISAIESIVEEHRESLLEAWQTISRVEINVPDAVSLEITDDTLTVHLNDARTIAVPVAWYPRLVHGSDKERGNWRFLGRGQGIHWDDLDEDISVEGLLADRPSGESQASLQRWLDSRSAK